jgi:signal transduction histidine kinase
LEYAQVGHDSAMDEWVDLNLVLKTVQMNLTKEIEESNARITIEKSLPTLIGNKTSLLQLFQNLLSNAIKFRKNTPPTVCITFSKKVENYFEFAIKDNGIGIDEEYKEHIFKPFKRLHRTQEGQGIGLSICKKVVEMHKGEIYLKSVVGEGTTFFVLLPTTPIQEEYSKKIILQKSTPDAVG